MELFKDPYGILALAAKNPPEDEEEDSFWNKKTALHKPRKTGFWRKKLQKHDQCMGAFR